jgi:hypothetical protein
MTVVKFQYLFWLGFTPSLSLCVFKYISIILTSNSQNDGNSDKFVPLEIKFGENDHEFTLINWLTALWSNLRTFLQVPSAIWVPDINPILRTKSFISLCITPCGPLGVGRRFGWICLLHLLPATCFTLVSCLVYSLTLKMEATCSSEASVGFQRTTRRYTGQRRDWLWAGRPRSRSLSPGMVRNLLFTWGPPNQLPI